MEDVKDKMKNLMKKANKPFSSSSAFKGQAHILGSSTSNSSSSRLIPPLRPTINKSDSRVANCIKTFLSGQPAESSVEIMIKLLRNVAQEPENDKFRKIRMGNARIKEAVGDVMGGEEVLECAGFRIEEEEGERWARMGEVTRERIEGIRDLILGLERWRGEEEKVVGDGVVENFDGGEEEEMMIDRKVV